MLNQLFIVTLIFFLTTQRILGAPASQSGTAIQIHPVQPVWPPRNSEDMQLLAVKSFNSIDWSTLAHKYIKVIPNIDSPTKDERKMLVEKYGSMFDDSYLTFEIPGKEINLQGHFYILSDGEVEQVNEVKIRGEARYRWIRRSEGNLLDQKEHDFSSIDYDGLLLVGRIKGAVGKNRVHHFVMFSPERLKIKQAAVAISEGQLLLDGSNFILTFKPPTHSHELKFKSSLEHLPRPPPESSGQKPTTVTITFFEISAPTMKNFALVHFAHSIQLSPHCGDEGFLVEIQNDTLTETRGVFNCDI